MRNIEKMNLEQQQKTMRLPLILNMLKCVMDFQGDIHPLYSMNKFLTNKSKLPQDGAQVLSYTGWLAIM